MNSYCFHMKKQIISWVIIILMACVSSAGANEGNVKEVIKKAAQGGLFEVEAGNIAASKASRTEVKDLAKNIVTEHKKANEDLMTIAKTKGIEAPIETSQEHKAQLEKLRNAGGNEFDKVYLDMMVKDHQKDVDTFRKWSEKIDDPELKAWIVKTLPVLEKHLQLARELNKSKQ
jgi:putative membrane protein